MKTRTKNICEKIIPDIESTTRRNDWIFIQHGAPSNCLNFVQDILRKKILHDIC